MHAAHASLPGAFDEHLTLIVGLDPIAVRLPSIIPEHSVRTVSVRTSPTAGEPPLFVGLNGCA